MMTGAFAEMYKKVFNAEKLNGKIAIYGAGFTGRALCDQLLGNGLEVMNFCDSNPKKQGTEYRGIRVISRDELFKLCSDQECFVFIAINSNDTEELEKQLAICGNIIPVVLHRDSIYVTEVRDYFSLKLDIHLVDECNLNCRGCSHFSPLAVPGQYRLTLEDFEIEIKRIQKIFGDHYEDMIYLIGGEPLLHEKVAEFPYIFRKYLKSTRLFLFTNGILLKQQNPTFWESCRKNGIRILITKYPVSLDYDALEALMTENEVEYEIIPCKIGRYTTLDFENQDNGEASFINCSAVRESCSTLKNGKIYPCVVAPHFHLFKDYFDIKIENKDGISIYENYTREEMLYKIANERLQLCRYCDFNQVEEWDWNISKKECQEWCSNDLCNLKSGDR